MKDRAVQKLIDQETRRQSEMVNLIASENIVSDDVLAALGSPLTNKYAEGYVGKRYYGGNVVIDEVENLAKERAFKLFKLSDKKWDVNVQALSGSPANLAVLQALVPHGGKIMGMDLAHGGHLTHGFKASITGKLWKQIPYGVDQKTEMLDYAALMKVAKKEKPTLVIAGFTAYPRIVDWKKFRAIANACGALLMADMSHVAGLVAGGVYPSPFPYTDVVTTTTHKTLRGPRGALIFAKKDLMPKIDKAVFPGLQGGPHMNAVAAIAVALDEAMRPVFKKYAAHVVKNAKALADELKGLGWMLVAGGTDSHLILVDTVNSIGMSGGEASTRLEKAGIIVNKNTIPFDTRSPMDPSGIRVGSAMETTKGKREKDFRAIAKKIDEILRK